MTSFIQLSYPTEHGGVARIESALSALGALRRRFDSTKGLSAMLLAAMVSALLVVADQLIDTWADGHLLAAWIALWLIGFAAIAIFAGAARKVAVATVHSVKAGARRRAQARAEEEFWLLAESDPGLRADLNAAIKRSERSVGLPHHWPI